MTGSGQALGLMGGNKGRRPKPSYEEGKLRDPSIEKMQGPKYQRGDLFRLLRRAVSKVTKGKAPERA